MNPSKHLSPAQQARWQALWDLLDSIRLEPLPAAAEADEVLAELPPRKPQESLSHWLDRAHQLKHSILLAEFERKAAFSGTEQYPLPEIPMRSANGRFQLTVMAQEGVLLLRLQALGPAKYQHRNRQVFLGQKDGGGLWQAIALDGQGAGTAQVDDDLAARQTLLRPCIFSQSEHAQ